MGFQIISKLGMNKMALSKCNISLLKAGIFAAVVTSQSLCAQSVVHPILAKNGPVSDVPVAIQNARWAMLNGDINTITFRNMDQLFTTREVAHSGTVSTFVKNEKPLDFTYQFNGQTYTPDEFLDRTYTNAMLIMKEGKIVYENYRNNTNPNTRFMAWSMTKSLTSILVGIAYEQGLIKSLDDDITDYLPELSTGAYKGVTVRQVLGMRSGVAYEERYDFANPGIAATNHILALVKNVARFVEPAKTIKRKHNPGDVFEYKTIDTAVLGLLLERVTGQHVAAYMAQYLWEPLGTQSNGFFIMDGQPGVGREFTGAGFNATLRDFARVGAMMLNQGKFNGKQIVPAKWIELSTVSVGPEDNVKGGYGYQWWTMANSDAYSAIGLQGQFIYVDEASETVIVKLSYFPPGKDVTPETLAFFNAASLWHSN